MAITTPDMSRARRYTPGIRTMTQTFAEPS